MTTAWSYSALTSFETCPFRHFKTRIEKSVADPPGEAAQWGTRVHKVLEDRLKAGPDSPITGVMACYEPYAAKVEQLRAPTGVLHAEQRIALTEDLTMTGYFSKDVWLRVVVDVTVNNRSMVVALDWKTGKRKTDTGQLELTAAAMASVYPHAEKFKTGYVWLKDKVFDAEDFTPDDAPRIWSKFVPRVQRLEKAVQSGDFPKKPSGLCRKWCPVKECEFHGQ
jgi:hypothetical protein